MGIVDSEVCQGFIQILLTLICFWLGKKKITQTSTLSMITCMQLYHIIKKYLLLKQNVGWYFKGKISIQKYT